jgi:SH3-like domain-containing protein
MTAACVFVYNISTMRRFALVLAFAVFALPAEAAHYASLRSDKVFLREGPTFKHPVLFVYRRRDYPVEVLASYETWRRVRDADGTVGWMSATMLSDVRTVLIVGKGHAPLLAAPYAAAPKRAEAEPGVVAKLKACKPQFCEIAASGLTGWIDRSRIWGVGAGEVFE